MTNETKPNEAFEQWLRGHPDQQAEILKIYSRQHLRDLCKGTASFDAIPLGKRVRLHEITQLPFLQVEGESPRNLDMKRVIQGEQPRSLIMRRIEYDNLTIQEVAEPLGVHRETLSRYLRNSSSLSPTAIKGIESELVKYYSASDTLAGSARTVFPEENRI